MRTGKMVIAMLLVAALSFAVLADAQESSAAGGTVEGYGDSDTMSASYREAGGDGLIDVTLKATTKAEQVTVSVAGQTLVVPTSEINIGVAPLGIGNYPILITDNGIKLAECILTVAEYFTVTVETDGNGTATASLSKAKAGDTVSLSASPSDGFAFDSWQVVSGGVTIDGDSFEMPASDVTVKATFKTAALNVHIVVSGSGSVSSSDVQAEYGTSISASGRTLTIGTETVTATAGTGYSFSGWLGIPSSGEVTASLTVTAVFVKDSPGPTPIPPATTYKVTVETDGNGTAKATPSSATSGTIITLTATPNEGYVFKEWQSSSGITITNDRFTMPARGVTVKAVFEKAGSIDVSLDRTSATMDVGDKLTLVATVTPSTTPDKSVNWSSSDTSVVTVSNGVVTAVGPGTATVTVTTNVGGKTATCTVMVILPDVVIEADEGEIPVDEISAIVDKVLPGQSVILDATGSDRLVVDADAVLAILEKDAVVTVETDYGSVQIPKGSLVDIPEGAEMVITLTDTDAPSGFAGKVPEGSVVVDVTITVGDMIVTAFGEPITISLPCGDFDDPSKLKVYHLADDGKMTDMGAVYDPVSHCMVFQTGHLSVYAIVETSDEPVPSEDGDSTMLYVAVILAVVVIVVILAVLVTRKRN